MSRISVAGVWIRDGKVFLAQRDGSGDMAGRWELPGGKCEGGETPSAALCREFMEEFGLEIRVGALAAVDSFLHAGIDHELQAYFIDADEMPPVLNEHTGFSWFELENLPSPEALVDSDLRVLRKIVAARRGIPIR